jgi:hypothetical protein
MPVRQYRFFRDFGRFGFFGRFAHWHKKPVFAVNQRLSSALFLYVDFGFFDGVGRCIACNPDIISQIAFLLAGW